MDTKITTIRLPKDLAEEAMKRAKQESRSFSNLLIVALREYLARAKTEELKEIANSAMDMALRDGLVGVKMYSRLDMEAQDGIN